MATIGLALIAKDEAESLPHLLGSIEGAFDQVILLDTGSSDRTVEVFEVWAQGQHLPLGFKVDYFEWVDDFAAARNAADALLKTDWLCWVDCDDEILGASSLRAIVAAASPPTLGFRAFYDYGPEEGFFITRLTRRGFGKWLGRVSECRCLPDPDRSIQQIRPVSALWGHRKGSSIAYDRSRLRDNRLLDRWLAAAPADLLPLATAVRFSCHLELPSALSHYWMYCQGALKAEVERAKGGDPAAVERLESPMIRSLRSTPLPSTTFDPIPGTVPRPIESFMGDERGRPLSYDQIESRLDELEVAE